jgi:quercetin dioxygenase-like cupin family protein
VQSWDLTAIDAPDGTRDPVVLDTADGARGVLIVIAPGQALGEHEVKERTWLLVVEGRARIESGGDAIDAGPGTLATFKPGERHAISSDAGARILLLLAPWPGEGHYRGEERSLSAGA